MLPMDRSSEGHGGWLAGDEIGRGRVWKALNAMCRCFNRRVAQSDEHGEEPRGDAKEAEGPPKEGVGGCCADPGAQTQAVGMNRSGPGGGIDGVTACRWGGVGGRQSLGWCCLLLGS